MYIILSIPKILKFYYTKYKQCNKIGYDKNLKKIMYCLIIFYDIQ